MQLLSKGDQAAVESHLPTVLLRALEARAYGEGAPAQGEGQGGGDGMDAMRRVITTYVMQSGKRVRPQLVVWVWRVLNPTQPLPRGVLDMACVWELFHAFLLVHDDLIDESDLRRGLPALHCRLAELEGGNGAKIFGSNLAIVAGDLLFSGSLRVLHELAVPPAELLPLMRLFSDVACLTGLGQAIDIAQGHLAWDAVDEQVLLREYHWKTAAYTFDGPMRSGAMLAGLCDAGLMRLREFAMSLGQAYQVHNDLLDLAQPADAGCDLVQGKRTLTLAAHRKQCGDTRAFDRLAGIAADAQCPLADRLVAAESLREQVLTGPGYAQTRRIIDGLLATSAAAAADEGTLGSRLSAALRALLKQLASGYFATVD